MNVHSVVRDVPRSDINWIRAEQHRVLLAITVFVGAMVFWIAPRPGLVDLPQHAAQVALLHDLLTGTSPWRDLVRINYFTPYLSPYGLALALSFVMPVADALKLMLTLAYLSYVATGIALRNEFSADRRLDWLFVPGFFGFAYQWGFYSFLVAVPLAFLFLVFAHRFARSPSFSKGLLLTLAGVGLFFSHGLVFLFACATGAAFTPFFCRTAGRMITGLAPYITLGVLALAYYFALHHGDLLVPDGSGGVVNVTLSGWLGPYGWHRSFTFLLYTVATERADGYWLLGVAFLLAAPWLMGARLNTKHPTSFVMFVAVLVIWLGVPSDALGTSALYQRFAIFLLPAYALMFRQASDSVPIARQRSLTKRGFQAPVCTTMMLFCVCYLCTLAVREYRFAQASAPFETVLAAAEPGQRALNLNFDPRSEVMKNGFAYLHYPLWYQAEKSGFVDFNFVVFLPQIVRFKPDRVPPTAQSLRPDRQLIFGWHAMHARQYRYFFVHHSQPLPASLFDNDECEVALVKAAGDWSLFERRRCH